MTAWTPQVDPDRRWNPQVPAEVSFSALTRYFNLLPYLTPQTQLKQPKTIVDLRPLVAGGAQPYAFTLGLDSNFPVNTILEPNGRMILPFGELAPGLLYYTATVNVVDANNQATSFVVSVVDPGNGVLTLSGLVGIHFDELPDAHGSNKLDWQVLYSGGIPPISFRIRGLSFGALGFTFDQATGLLSGLYNGSLGDSFDNLVLVDGFNSGTDPAAGIPDTSIAGTWDLYIV